MVEEFPFLGCEVASDDRVDVELMTRLANASKAFGALGAAVFKDSNLTITTSHKAYQASVLSMVLYGA